MNIYAMIMATKFIAEWGGMIYWTPIPYFHQLQIDVAIGAEDHFEYFLIDEDGRDTSYAFAIDGRESIEYLVKARKLFGSVGYAIMIAGKPTFGLRAKAEFTPWCVCSN